MKQKKEGRLQNHQPVDVKRNYKDTLFRMLFHDKEELLSLFNAVNGSAYKDPQDLEIVTLENAIYMNLKNDLAFIIDFQLSLYEHQSSYNPNMPLRYLLYVAKEYQKLIKNESLYAESHVKIPTPHFVIFYNGKRPMGDQTTLKLSDAYQIPSASPDLDLKVTLLNINLGHNKHLADACKTLKEYMLYVDRVRTYAQTMTLNYAVERAVNECIQEGILSEFLSTWKTEAIAVSIFEYDAKRDLELLRKTERKYMRIELREEVKKEVEEELRPQLIEELRPQLTEELRPQLTEELRPQLTEELRPQLTEELRPQLTEELRPQLTEELRPQLEAELRKEIQMDTQAFAIIKAYRNLGISDENISKSLQEILNVSGQQAENYIKNIP